ncbi:MAG TPA: diacylglycerol kinase family protein [Desulfotomaculum sp.]|nr:MAG: diacylglycerol kinase [Peptococcaceae bacterium BRH_c8a]KJS74119.1 MAG: diacylglycerol kinase [Desulfotomaculum sp. BICA1-6]HBX22845.1 diacylglycerol kinase family protein [Desulfotomaculum sp.]
MFRLLKSFGWALSGIRQVSMTQPNMKIHLAAALLVIIVCVSLLHMPALELAIVILAIFMVLVAETFNTAVEATVDLTTSRRHPLAKVAKDAAAGAVLLTAVNAIVVAYLLIWPYLKNQILR